MSADRLFQGFMSADRLFDVSMPTSELALHVKCELLFVDPYKATKQSVPCQLFQRQMHSHVE